MKTMISDGVCKMIIPKIGANARSLNISTWFALFKIMAYMEFMNLKLEQNLSS